MPARVLPVLAVGGEKSFGAMMAVVRRAAASEENPDATIALVTDFLAT
jgi:hypothetical protein